MGYATRQQVYNILSQGLTSATNPVVNGQPVPLWTFGKNKSNNSIPDTDVDQYIAWAGEQIEGALNELYVTPLQEKSDLEMSLLRDIDSYNDIIELSRGSSLNSGDVLVFIDAISEERHTVVSVSGKVVTLSEPLIGVYYAETTRIIRVKYPPNINLICCRLSAANLFDKYFAAQSNPDVSDYGKTLRRLALSDLNSIIAGITILHGQKRIGNRFYNANLNDRYHLPPIEGGETEIKGGDA